MMHGRKGGRAVGRMAASGQQQKEDEGEEEFELHGVIIKWEGHQVGLG